jgi:hypothetical protein
MDRNSIVWVLECCLLSLDGISKKQMLEFGCPEDIAEMGIKLCDFLISKENYTITTQ